jgi:hypothetical protein
MRRAKPFRPTWALLLQRLLTKRLKEAEADLSAPHALQAVETIRMVEFKVGRQKRQGASRGSPYAGILCALGVCLPASA